MELQQAPTRCPFHVHQFDLEFICPVQKKASGKSWRTRAKIDRIAAEPISRCMEFRPEPRGSSNTCFRCRYRPSRRFRCSSGTGINRRSERHPVGSRAADPQCLGAFLRVENAVASKRPNERSPNELSTAFHAFCAINNRGRGKIFDQECRNTVRIEGDAEACLRPSQKY